MDIDKLTIGEAKEIARLFGGNHAATHNDRNIGRRVIVRTYSAGVHYGTLEERHGDQVVITDTCRIWRWRGPLTLSELALYGCDSAEESNYTRVSERVESNTLEAIETLTCTEEACRRIESAGWAK